MRALLCIGLLGCSPRTRKAPDAPAACTLRLATLPNSAWHSGEATLRFATSSIRYSRGTISQMYGCDTVADEQALRCTTTPDALAWCRARLANRRACDPADLLAHTAALSDEQINDAIVEAAEEHALIAGTEQENYFTERYARPEDALLHILQIRPDPGSCQLRVQETALRMVGGEWDEAVSPPVSYAPMLP